MNTRWFIAPPPVYSVKKFETQTFQVLICADEVVVTTKMLPEWTTVYSLFLATIGRGKQNQPSLELAVSFIPTYNIYAISPQITHLLILARVSLSVGGDTYTIHSRSNSLISWRLEGSIIGPRIPTLRCMAPNGRPVAFVWERAVSSKIWHWVISFWKLVVLDPFGSQLMSIYIYIKK